MDRKTLDHFCKEAFQRNLPLIAQRDAIIELKWVEPPRPQASFGLINDWVRLGDEVENTFSTLFVPFQPQRLGWVRGETLRLFRFDTKRKCFEKVKDALLH